MEIHLSRGIYRSRLMCLCLCHTIHLQNLFLNKIENKKMVLKKSELVTDVGCQRKHQQFQHIAN